MAYWGQAGDKLIVRSIDSRTGVEVQVSARVRHEDGSFTTLRVSFNTDGTRVVQAPFESPNILPRAGELVSAMAFPIESTLASERGEIYIEAGLGTNNKEAHRFMKGYIYEAHVLSLGDMEEPGSGDVPMKIVALASDIAPADITSVLALTNTKRIVYGFVWYYNAAAVVATRTMRVALQNVGGAKPTGFTVATIVWLNNAAVSLTTGEEGNIYVYSQEGKTGLETRNDNGTLTTVDGGVNPSPFPLEVHEDDLAELFFDVGAPDAADRHSIFLFVKEWIVA